MTMSDAHEELERLRRDVDQLLARLPAGDQGQPQKPPQELVNENCVRQLKESLAREGKTRGIVICRVVVVTDEHGTGVSSGIITSTNADDFEKWTKLRPSVAALATD